MSWITVPNHSDLWITLKTALKKALRGIAFGRWEKKGGVPGLRSVAPGAFLGFLGLLDETLRVGRGCNRGL